MRTDFIMKLSVFLIVLLTVLVQKNKADEEFGEDMVQDMVKKFSQINYGESSVERATCLPINTTLIKIKLYTPKNIKEEVLLKIGEDNDLSLLDPLLETKILTHGWIDNSGTWSTTAKNAYLEKGDYNIILLDWSKYGLYKYAESVCYIKQVAEIAASFLIEIRNKTNLDFKKTHVIGHSLGGQLAGLIGQHIQKLTGGEKLRRITGLDSAGPSFCHPVAADNDQRITADDADYVDAIHTCGSSLGCEISYGTADFFPNCGIVQPGCGSANLTLPSLGSIQGVCSHLRAVRYWIESINSDGFIAAPCKDCATNTPNSCEKNTSQIMGEHSSSLATGNYYLTTKSSSPFAEG